MNLSVKINIKILAAIFSTVVFQNNVFSQSYIFNNYNVQQGLAQSKVYAVIQDSKGYLWAATDDGVSVFDGKSFQNFSAKDGLATGSVTAITEDKNGIIWLGHITGGITQIEQGTNGSYHKKFKAFSFSSLHFDKRIFSISQVSSGSIWLCTEQFGAIQIINPAKNPVDTNNFRSYTILQGMSNLVFTMMEDSNNILWFITDAGIINYFPRENKFKFFNVHGLPFQQFTSILEDRSGNIWLGTFNGGVIQFIPQTNSIKTFTSHDGLSSEWITSLLQDKSGNIWMGTWGGGVSIFNGNKFETLNVSHGLSENKVRCMMQDREGNIWFGTNEGGLSCYRGKKFITWAEKDGLLNEQVSAVFQDSKGNFWLGTNEGISMYSPAKNSFRNISLKDKMGYGQVMSVTEDKTSSIWAGTLDGGVAEINPVTLQYKIFTEADFLTNNHVNAMATDSFGNIWAGTIDGISVFNPQKHSHEIIGKADGLSSNNIAALYCDSKGNIWIGTRGGGLNVMYKNGTVKSFSQKNEFSHHSASSITGDKHGNIWIGTEGGGIYSYNPANSGTGGNKFTNYLVKDGLISDYIILIIADDDNNIWAGTNRGLNKFSPQSKSWTFYGKSEGFTPIETKHNAVMKDSEGFLWFGTPEGVVRYDKKYDYPNAVFSLTYITGFRIGLDNAEMIPGMRLNYKQRDLSFDFTGLCFSASENVRYRYQLAGLDENWHQVTEQNNATYTNIPAGNYTFRVVSCNNDGLWNIIPATFSFSIKPPFRQTVWFYGLISILISTCIVLYIRIRTRLLRKQKQVLEINVEQRTAELKQTLEELKSTQAQLVEQEKLASLGQMTAGIAHEIQNPLNFVNNFSEVSNELIEEIRLVKDEAERTEILANLKNNLEKINLHGKRADSIVKGMLMHSRTGKGEKQLTDINALCEEAINLAYHSMRAKIPDFNCEIEKSFDKNLPQVKIIPQDISRVILNLLNNAFYATSPPTSFQRRGEFSPKVFISTIQQFNNLTITIRDNGIGIPENIRDKIFEPFFTTKPTGEGTGLGLSISYDIVKAHGGEIKVESEEGAGTEFNIILPA